MTGRAHVLGWGEVVAYALSLPDTELSTSYGKPAVKVASNGRAFVFAGQEEATSFGIAVDLDTVEMLKETDPATFWQTQHYEGWAAVLVRFATRDPERVWAVIAQSHAWAAAKTRVKPRRGA